MKCKLDCPYIMQTNREPYSPSPQLSSINVLKLEKKLHTYVYTFCMNIK